MKKIISVVTIYSLLTLTVGCAHHRDVRPSADGVHKVILKTEDKDEGYRGAMRQAEDYCEKVAGNKAPMVVKEGSQYGGSLEESTYKNAKTASKVAQAVGGAGYAFGGRRESTAGGIVGLGAVSRIARWVRHTPMNYRFGVSNYRAFISQNSDVFFPAENCSPITKILFISELLRNQ